MKRPSVKIKQYWIELPGGGYYPFDLKMMTADMLHLVGRWDVLNARLDDDMALARAYGLEHVEGRCLMLSGEVDYKRGDCQGARGKISQAMSLLARHGRQEDVFKCQVDLAWIALETRDYGLAERIALELISQSQDSFGMLYIQVQNILGLAYQSTGRYQLALDTFKRALELSDSAGRGKVAAAALLANIGSVHYGNGRYPEAAELFRQSLEVCRQSGDIFTEYYALYNLAGTLEKMGHLGSALIHYQRDLALARQLGDGPGEQVIRENLGRINGKRTG
ncbi:MAG: tetratricopeptide repeat protein [Deltaproteobacteria bacterium]|nr:tetratricopeptide repeat protein [Deltaproteobacteria bacterium]